MKRILVIGSVDSGSKNDPKVMATELQGVGCQVEVWHWEDLVFDISSATINIKHEDASISELMPDLVIAVGWYKNGKQSIYRDIAHAFALYLDALGIEFWNSEMLYQRSTTKLSCMMKLALSGIAVPRTLFSLKQTHLEGILELPCIVKAASASRGESNYLVESHDRFTELLRDDTYYIVQPFMSNDHDLRVICYGGVPSLVLRRARKGSSESHLNNTSMGASARWLSLDQLPSELLTKSREICTIMNREMSGIDFIPDPNSPYEYACLEVNAIPQLTSGSDPERKLRALAQSVIQKGNTLS